MYIVDPRSLIYIHSPVGEPSSPRLSKVYICSSSPVATRPKTYRNCQVLIESIHDNPMHVLCNEIVTVSDYWVYIPLQIASLNMRTSMTSPICRLCPTYFCRLHASPELIRRWMRKDRASGLKDENNLNVWILVRSGGQEVMGILG